jgi:hypothetical protein
MVLFHDIWICMDCMESDMSKEQTALKLALELRQLADKFSEGWHDGIKIDASDIVLLADAAEALAERFCDNNCTWRDHHPDCDKAEQPAPPPECQTEAEKTAFAFGWWKALEMHRKPAQQQSCYCPNCEALGKELAALRAQEPVAWRWVNPKGWLTYGEQPHDIFASTPLYTSPPASKPWVGLSNDEIYDMYNEPRSDAEMIEFACAIEAMLREKNTGEQP